MSNMQSGPDTSNNNGFFDRHPAFLDSSQTNTHPNRLRKRHEVLIDLNQKILCGQSILDLASHDGRWSCAALECQAKYVLGIEGRKDLVQHANGHMKRYDIPDADYDFITGDLFDEIKKLTPGQFDVILCFGFLYHTAHHMLLLQEIKRLKPKYLILDTQICRSTEVITLWTKEDSTLGHNSIQMPYANDTAAIVGSLSRPALNMMLGAYSFECEYYDWQNKGIVDWGGMQDYEKGYRVSLVAKNIY